MTDSWLVLDVDDTIVDTHSTGFAKCQEVARLLGLKPLHQSAFDAVYGSKTFDECVQHWYPTVNVGRYGAIYERLADQYPPVPLGSVVSALNRVARAGLRIGVLTNGTEQKTVSKLAALGLKTSDFEFVVYESLQPTPKPSPLAFNHMAESYGVDPKRSWYVSDSPADWNGAATAGFGVVGIVRWKRRRRGPTQVPQLMLPDLSAAIGCEEVLKSDIPHISPSERIHAVTIDAGFTLLDHLKPPAVTAPLDFPIPAAEIWTSDAAIKMGLSDYYRALAPSWTEEVISSHIADYVSHINWRARPGAVEFLRRLHSARLRVGVLSNWQTTLAVLLSEVGLDGFDAVIPSALLGFAKPDPRAFLAAVNKLDVKPSSIVHVGDDPVRDAAGAIASGCRAFVVQDQLTSPIVQAGLMVLTR